MNMMEKHTDTVRMQLIKKETIKKRYHKGRNKGDKKMKRTIKTVAAFALLTATLTSMAPSPGPVTQNEPEALAQIQIEDTSDALYVSDADCVIYELSDSRTYGNPGNKNDHIDFEAYFGISLAVENNTVTAATYTHQKSSSPKSITFGRLSSREMVSPRSYTMETVSIDMAKLSDGVYEFKSEFDTKNGTRYVSGYVYKNGSSIQTCRTVMSQDADGIRRDMNKWNTVMADADPSDYLSNAMITYPTSGDGKYCNHTSAWEQISDEIIGDKTELWSDETKVFAFVQYLVDNVAYDNYKLKMSKKYGTTSRARLAGDYTDDSMFTIGNNVGVCWDYVNILAIMCRHHGIPATSADYGTHTVSAVWLNNGWKAIDITVLAKYSCSTEDTSRENWTEKCHERYSAWYGYYDIQVQEFDANIWTQEKGRG